MPEISQQKFYTKDPTCYDYTHLGTAAGTTTILTSPGFLSHISINNRVAGGTIVLYDSVGTSSTVIGTITLGTQTFSDPVPFVYKVRTKNGLSISYPANIDLTVSAI